VMTGSSIQSSISSLYSGSQNWLVSFSIRMFLLAPLPTLSAPGVHSGVHTPADECLDSDGGGGGVARVVAAGGGGGCSGGG